jgi:hypothetical protein
VTATTPHDLFLDDMNRSCAHDAEITGIYWLVLNWALDVLVLVGFTGMKPADCLSQTGLRYLMIPAMVNATVVVADMAVMKKESSLNGLYQCIVS